MLVPGLRELYISQERERRALRQQHLQQTVSHLCNIIIVIIIIIVDYVVCAFRIGATTEVSGVENIGQCGRLNQLSWLLKKKKKKISHRH